MMKHTLGSESIDSFLSDIGWSLKRSQRARLTTRRRTLKKFMRGKNFESDVVESKSASTSLNCILVPTLGSPLLVYGQIRANKHRTAVSLWSLCPLEPAPMRRRPMKFADLRARTGTKITSLDTHPLYAPNPRTYPESTHSESQPIFRQQSCSCLYARILYQMPASTNRV